MSLEKLGENVEKGNTGEWEDDENGKRSEDDGTTCIYSGK